MDKPKATPTTIDHTQRNGGKRPNGQNQNKALKYRWNVVNESDFRRRVNVVFEVVAKALSNTLGPFGSTTIIEKLGESHITKDGWQVLKSIRFDNLMDNTILQMLQRISAQVVVKVGDGSTSSIVAASNILKEMNKHASVLNGIRPKELMDLMRDVSEEIVSYIYKDAKLVNRETYEEIYKLAYISTNGNEEISQIIKEVYTRTNNPSIEYRPSKTEKTFYDIIDGYRLERTRYLDAIFQTEDDGSCSVNNPLILMFDHDIDLDTGYKLIGKAAEKAAMEGRRVVVIAPGYSKQVRDIISSTVLSEMKSRAVSTVIYCWINMLNALDRTMFSDFAVMTGAEVIRENLYDNEEYPMDKIGDWIVEKCGEVEEITITREAQTIVRGLKKRNENIYQKVLNDAVANLKKMEADYSTRSTIDIKLTENRNRVSKLMGSMGTIHVGGYSSLEKASNLDLVEDAIKACESAYTYGYNSGGNLVIPYTIQKIIDIYEVNNIPIPKEKLVVLKVLEAAFINVFKTVILNKYRGHGFNGVPLKRPDSINEAYLNNVIKTCLSGKELKCLDLIKEEYSDEVINSCTTDIEILKASINTIGLILSSNQYISIDFTK